MKAVYENVNFIVLAQNYVLAGLSIGGVDPMGSITRELITEKVNLCTLRPVSYAPFKVEIRNESDLKHRVIRKSLRNFRTQQRNNQERHSREELISR
jgi:hypothetical protein